MGSVLGGGSGGKASLDPMKSGVLNVGGKYSPLIQNLLRERLQFGWHEIFSRNMTTDHKLCKNSVSNIS